MSESKHTRFLDALVEELQTMANTDALEGENAESLVKLGHALLTRAREEAARRAAAMSECLNLNEPWETTTKYGRADLTIHPIMREAYKVACLIERCGASAELTAASSAAFALCEQLFDLLTSLNAEGIAQQREIDRLRQQRDQLLEALRNVLPVYARLQRSALQDFSGPSSCAARAAIAKAEAAAMARAVNFRMGRGRAREIRRAFSPRGLLAAMDLVGMTETEKRSALSRYADAVGAQQDHSVTEPAGDVSMQHAALCDVCAQRPGDRRVLAAGGIETWVCGPCVGDDEPVEDA